MNAPSTSLRIASAVWLCFGLAPGDSEGAPPQNDRADACLGQDRDPESRYILLHYVLCAGRHVDFYLTVERVFGVRSEGELSPFDKLYDFPEPPEIRTVDELARHLQATLTGIVVRRSQRNPKVLHLIEEPLTRQAGYALDQVADLRFSGKIGELPDALGKQVAGLHTMDRGDWRTNSSDYVTRIDVEFKDRTVRDILTEAVPLKGYHRFLWRAQTYQQDGRWYTQVGYRGPEEPPEDNSPTR